MFRNWGFLITEMVVLIILAALLGLFVGWLIWGRRTSPQTGSLEGDRLKGDLEGCQTSLEACRAAGLDKDALIAQLRADLEVCRTNAAMATEAGAATAAVVPTADFDGDGQLEGATGGVKPAALDAARDGQPDDLKQIKGIGPKLEKLCNALGFYHFDQIAAWTDQEVAWVDANLEGFKGRVSRDGWVSQAKLLAAGGETAFSKRVEDGEVY